MKLSVPSAACVFAAMVCVVQRAATTVTARKNTLRGKERVTRDLIFSQLVNHEVKPGPQTRAGLGDDLDRVGTPYAMPSMKKGHHQKRKHKKATGDGSDSDSTSLKGRARGHAHGRGRSGGNQVMNMNGNGNMGGVMGRFTGGKRGTKGGKTTKGGKGTKGGGNRGKGDRKERNGSCRRICNQAENKDISFDPDTQRAPVCNAESALLWQDIAADNCCCSKGVSYMKLRFSTTFYDNELISGTVSIDGTEPFPQPDRVDVPTSTNNVTNIDGDAESQIDSDNPSATTDSPLEVVSVRKSRHGNPGNTMERTAGRPNLTPENVRFVDCQDPCLLDPMSDQPCASFDEVQPDVVNGSLICFVRISSITNRPLFFNKLPVNVRVRFSSTGGQEFLSTIHTTCSKPIVAPWASIAVPAIDDPIIDPINADEDQEIDLPIFAFEGGLSIGSLEKAVADPLYEPGYQLDLAECGCDCSNLDDYRTVGPTSFYTTFPPTSYVTCSPTPLDMDRDIDNTPSPSVIPVPDGDIAAPVGIDRDVDLPDFTGEPEPDGMVPVALPQTIDSGTAAPTPARLSAPIADTGTDTKNPTISPSVTPTDSPTATPTKNPTKIPTTNPTTNPSTNPTPTPTPNPTVEASASPTISSNPTVTLSASPTSSPSVHPSCAHEPSSTPSLSADPDSEPVEPPVAETQSMVGIITPAPLPGSDITFTLPAGIDAPDLTEGVGAETPPPTVSPTARSTDRPTPLPTGAPTAKPTTAAPTANPTEAATGAPSSVPTCEHEDIANAEGDGVVRAANTCGVEGSKSIYDYLCSVNNFAHMCTMIERAGLRDLFSGNDVETPFITLFAPTNKGCDSGGLSLDDINNTDQDTLKHILLTHGTDGEVLSKDLKCDGQLPTLKGTYSVTTTQCYASEHAKAQYGFFNIEGDYPMILSPKDLELCNGIIQPVNNLIRVINF